MTYLNTYSGLTVNKWPGTWSPSDSRPIVLDTEIRGTLQSISGSTGDQLTDISGSRLTPGMMVFVQASYTAGSYTRNSSTYYTYALGTGQIRDPVTGAMPNAESNWSPFLNSADPTAAVHITNTTTSTSTTTGEFIVDGGVGIGGDVNVAGQVSAERVKITDAIIDSTLVLVNTTATTVIDSYPFGSYRSAKYLVQIDETGGAPTASFQVIEILLLVDNGGTVYATEYGQLSTAGALGDFSAGLDGADNMVKLYFTPYQTTNKEVVVLRTALVL